MNICLISAEYPPETGWGGIGTYTRELARGLVEAGHRVTAIASAVTASGSRVEEGVELCRIFDRRPPLLPRLLRKLVQGRRFVDHLVHSESVFAKVAAIEAERGSFDVIEAPLWNGEGAAYSQHRHRAPLVVRLQTPVFMSRELVGREPDRQRERIERLALQKCALVGAISRNVGELVATRYGIPDAKMRHAPLGMRFPSLASPLFDANSRRLLYVGRLEHRKGTQDLIEALPAILMAHPDIEVDIVGRDTGEAPGSGSFVDYCQHVVPEALQARVRFHGHVSEDELQRFYRACDVFVAPSRYESFGLIYLEAMGYGKPVVATRSGGIPEVVDPSVGRLVDIGVPEQIATAAIELLLDVEERRRLGANAFRHARQHFSIESMVRSTLDLYHAAMAGQRHA